MLRHRFLILVTLLCTVVGSRSLAAKPADDLARLFDESWQFDMQQSPLWATQVGEHSYDDRLASVSVADSERRLAVRRKFLLRLAAIDRDGLSRRQQINYDIFARLTGDQVAEAELKSYLMPITNRSGFHISFAELARRVPLETTRDYENYIARLLAFDHYAGQHIELMRIAIAQRYVLPAVVLKGYRDPISAHIVDDPRDSLLYKAFTLFPEAISPADQKRLEKAGRQAIKNSVVPGYRRFLKFMETEYVPAAPGIIGASSLPGGREFYRHRVRKYTTLDDATPQQIYATGIKEVKRIRGEMMKVIRSLKFKGDLPAFLKFLRTDPQFYATTPEQLLKETAFQLKRMDGQLPKLFKTLPRIPYGIRKIPDYIAPNTTTAYYSLPSGDGTAAGQYYVNTFNLKSRPLYGVQALSFHEAVPGHHLQLALQQELTGLPKFRRFAGFTVFVEGWALYAERLGLEVGFYQDPYANFGRLTYEMWRACRLVVDPGMHYLGWTRERAIDFMAQNTALSMYNIRCEVDRYISWPGQAIAYKTGELKIRQLRARAEQRLGEAFDIREFHEVVLGSGSVPLAVLEDNVNAYISKTTHSKTTHSKTTNTKTTPAKPMQNATKMAYPKTRKTDQVDDYHGTLVVDPYRWLEDPDADETRQWVKAQNELTFGYLKTVPQTAWFRKRLTKLWNYEKFGTPKQRGGRYFFTRNTGLQNQSVLYVADSPDDEPRMLLDPNRLSKDGTVALTQTAISDDGRLMAYELSASGSDWRQWKVRDVASGRDLSDHLKWVKFSGAAWTPDGKGFYYSRYDEPKDQNELTAANYFQKLYYHRIGTKQSADQLVYHRPDKKKWGFSGTVTDDGRYLVIHVWRGTEQKNDVFYQDLSQNDGPVVELLKDFDAEYELLGNEGPVFWLKTDKDAERGRIIAIDTAKPAPKQWREVVPQSADTLRGASMVGDRFFVSYLKDARTVVRMFGLDGKPLGEVDLPGIGTAAGFGGRRKETETFYAFSGYTTPTTVYRYDLATNRSTVFRKPRVDFDPQQYETRQIFYHSKDGTRVPMFITHKKGLKLDGTNPTLLYAYGGFNIPITPRFSVSQLVWMEAGGVYAVANLRGGGEYGRSWHEAGMMEKKQNVFDDFIAAAEWLIAHRYTSSERLAIQGGSNGGLLVGACMTQRPDLFAVALPAVGVMDMLRFHRFTIGWAWVSEYGSAGAGADQFKTLLAYSPLHNIRPGTKYPATMVTTADHDDRVVPAHSFKFAATLQAAQSGSAPILIRIETRAGHGAGKPTTKRIDEAADLFGFTLHRMGVDVPQVVGLDFQ